MLTLAWCYLFLPWFVVILGLPCFLCSSSSSFSHCNLRPKYFKMIAVRNINKQYDVYFEAQSHWIQQDSNSGPLSLKSNALPSELPCLVILMLIFVFSLRTLVCCQSLNTLTCCYFPIAEKDNFFRSMTVTLIFRFYGSSTIVNLVQHSDAKKCNFCSAGHILNTNAI